MRVAVDATALITARTGVARYAEGLIRALDAAGVTTLPFAIGRGTVSSPLPLRRIGIPLRIMHRSWARLSWPRAESLLRGAVDVVHSLDMVLPPTRRPLVATVHDTAAVDHPELHPSRAVEIQRRQLGELGRAAVVIAVTEATAAAVRRWGVAADRVTVVHHGVTPLPIAERAVVDGRYFLAVGGPHPRKGFVELAESFLAAAIGDCALVFAGPPGVASPVLENLAASPRARGRVVLLGRVPDATLGRLYSDAVAVCVPSAAEGFGLPLLEAMSCRGAVLASDLAVFREVGGDAVEYVAASEDAWTAALTRIAADDARRHELVRRGADRVRRFTWDAAARQTVAAYEQALACA